MVIIGVWKNKMTVNIELLHDEPQCKRVLIKGPDFGIIFNTCLRPPDSKYPNFSVGNIYIYLPSDIFDKIVNILGEKCREHIKKDITGTKILKIDDKIQFAEEDIQE